MAESPLQNERTSRALQTGAVCAVGARTRGLVKRLRKFLVCLAASGLFIAVFATPAQATAFLVLNVIVTVDSVDYSGSFFETTLDPFRRVISGTVVTPDFMLSLTVSAETDPTPIPITDFGHLHELLSYDLSFAGVGSVSIAMMQGIEYLYPYNTLTSQTAGSLTDLTGDGSASVPLVQTAFVDGVTMTQQISACSATGTPGFQSAQCPPSLLAVGGLPPVDFDLPIGRLDLNVAFSVSAGDQVDLTGSTELSIPPVTPVPEPGSLGLMSVGLLITGVSARRRHSRAKRTSIVAQTLHTR
jgi:PEP-CTERM motif